MLDTTKTDCEAIWVLEQGFIDKKQQVLYFIIIFYLIFIQLKYFRPFFDFIGLIFRPDFAFIDFKNLKLETSGAFELCGLQET